MSKVSSAIAAAAAGAAEDRGMSRAERMWSLRSGRDVFKANEEVKPCEAIVMHVPLECFNDAPTKFSDFEHSKPGAPQFEALLHLLLFATQKLANRLQMPSAENPIQYQGFPLRVLVEPVFQATDYVPPPDAHEVQSQLMREHLKKLYCDNLLFLPPSAEDGGGDDDDEMHFMRGFRDRQVCAWRFWFFSFDPGHCVSKEVVLVLQNVFEHWAKDTEFKEPMVERSSYQQQLKRAGGDPVEAKRIAHSVTTTDRYWLIKSVSVYCSVYALYTADTSLSIDADNRRAKVLNPAFGFKNPISELYPGNFFDPARLFVRLANDERIDPAQRNIDNYLQLRGQAQVWTMPYANCVVTCDDTTLDVIKFTSRYVPTYQLEHIEPLFSNRSRASLRRQGLPDEDAARLLGGGAAAAAAPEAASDNDDDGSSSASASVVDNAECAELFRQMALDPPPAPRQLHGGPPGSAGVVAELRQKRIDAAAQQALANFARGLDMEDPEQRQRQRERDRSGAGAMQYETHRLRQRFLLTERPRIDAFRDPIKRARALVQQKLQGLAAYRNTCMSSFSDISSGGHVLVLEYEERLQQGRLTFQGDYRYFDKKLSFFGASMARWFEVYEVIQDTYTAHAECHLVFMVSLAAYWHKYGLRPHLFFYGAAGTSKSFGLETAKKYLSKGSVTIVSSASARATDIDDNENDEIHMFHETPIDMITGGSGTKRKGGAGGGAAGGAADKCDSTKTAMAEGITNRTVLHFDERTGRRTVKHVVSEKQKVMIMCSNVPREAIDQAVADRCLMVNQSERHRADGKTIADKQTAVHGVSPAKLAMQEVVRNDLSLRQTIVYHLDKNIMIGNVDEPTVTVFRHMWPCYAATLRQRFGIKLAPRLGEKVLGLLREHILSTTVEWLYNSPTSPVYKQPFEVSHFSIAEPMLHDSIEMVVFVLDLMRDQFTDPLQSAILKVIRMRILHKAIEESRGRQRKSQAGTPLDIFSSEFVGGKQFASAADDPKLRAVDASYIPKALAANNNNATQTNAGARFVANPTSTKTTELLPSLLSAARSVTYDYNYVQLPYDLKQLASHVQSEMEACGEARIATVDEVREKLYQMRNVHIRARPFMRNPKEASDPTAPLVVPDPLKDEQPLPAVQVGHGAKTAIHSALLFNAVVDTHEAALEACLTPQMPAMHCVAGRPVADTLPHVLAVRHLKPKAGAMIVSEASTRANYMSGVLGLDGAAAAGAASSTAHGERCMTNFRHMTKRGDPMSVLSQSLDELCVADRLRTLGIPVSKANAARWVYEYDRQKAVRMPGAVIEAPIDYPQACLEEAATFVRRKKLQEKTADMTALDIAERAARGEIVAIDDFADDDVDPDTMEDQDDAEYVRIMMEARASVRADPVNKRRGLDPERTLDSYAPRMTRATHGILGVDDDADIDDKVAQPAPPIPVPVPTPAPEPFEAVVASIIKSTTGVNVLEKAVRGLSLQDTRATTTTTTAADDDDDEDMDDIELEESEVVAKAPAPTPTARPRRNPIQSTHPKRFSMQLPAGGEYGRFPKPH